MTAAKTTLTAAIIRQKLEVILGPPGFVSLLCAWALPMACLGLPGSPWVWCAGFDVQGVWFEGLLEMGLKALSAR